MKKTFLIALAISAGIAGQAWAQVSWPDCIHITTAPNIDDQTGGVGYPVPTTKLGVLDFSLKNTFQAYSKSGHWGIEVKPYDDRILQGTVPWDNISYTYEDECDCNGVVTYRSNTRQINNATIIGAINKALSWPVGKNADFGTDSSVSGGPLVQSGGAYQGQFNLTAKIVVVNYDNGRYLPPYPPTEDYVGDEGSDFSTAVWNAPWYLLDKPYSSEPDGTIIPLNWPNLNYISWGKPWVPYYTMGATKSVIQRSDIYWVGDRVFLIDPKNVNENLRCFDVTPFFALEESYCFYCWDTMDRVTDGTITFGTSSSSPPCASGTSLCGVKGSGTTKLYWYVKFDNVMGGWIDDQNAPNYMLSFALGEGSLYYDFICGFDGDYGDTFGWKLDDSDEPGSVYALQFNVSGIANYPWKYQVLSDGDTWPMGKYSMSSAQGHGFSPMCGVFDGTVSLTEYDRANKIFGGVWCLAP
jgi:hypothetical protein